MDTRPLLLAFLLLFAVFLGATQIGRLSTEVRALAALTGAVLVFLYLRNLPRANDLTDRLVLVGLLLFLVTCVTSSAPRASFEAATTAMAYTAAFYLARGVLADDRSRRMAVTLLGLLGLVIGVLYLAIWGPIWLSWVASGAGVPPLDLRLPTLIYQGQYLVAMLAVMLLPATIALARRPLIWPLGVIGTVSCLLVAVMSGGRTVWLAAAAAAILALVATRGVRPSVPRRPIVIGALLVGLAVLIGVTLVAGPSVMARLGNTYTIELRFGIWGTALSHWLDSPLVGFGPGSFARELAATGYYSAYSVDIPHGHNALIQAVFEGGLVGLAGVGFVCAGVIVGAMRAGKIYWSAATALTFAVVASTTDNPTSWPFVVVLIIGWAALASPRAASAPRERSRSIQVSALGLAALVAMAVASTFLAASSFDRATDAAASRDRSAVVVNLRQAVAFDPSHPLYHRELGAWLGSDAREEAIQQLRTAIALNPSDTQAVRALALMDANAGDQEGAEALASRLVANYGTRIESALTAAYVHGAFGDKEEMDSALVTAVRRVPWIMASPEWHDAFPDADPTGLLRDAYASGQNPGEFTQRNLISRVWVASLLGFVPPPGTPVGLQLQSAVLRCDMQAAEQLSSHLSGATRSDFQSVLGRVLFENAADTPGLDDDTALNLRLRDPSLARLVSDPDGGSNLVPDAFQDINFYDRIPLAPHSVVALPTSPGGLSAWLRDPAGSARSAAPDSGIATCSDPAE